MFGGNDGNNTIIPLDTAGYGSLLDGAHRLVGNPARAIAISCPIEPMNGGIYGLHPSLGELQSLFAQNKMAILANVGTLTQPTTKAQYAAGVRPQSLYSHADQQAQWQSSISTGQSPTGWGGRLADQVASMNTDSELAGRDFARRHRALHDGRRVAGPCRFRRRARSRCRASTRSQASAARLAAVKSLLAQSSGNVFVTAVNAIGNQALDLSAIVNPILSSPSPTSIRRSRVSRATLPQQLHQVAKMIAARDGTGASRQIFFVQLGSFDTHGDQLNRQKALFDDLSPAVKAFYDATVAAGVGEQVTTFTLSDFGRTFQPASGGGTDHAWGNHHFIIGDAVSGGKLFGTYPQLVLAGPDDAESEGRWLPTSFSRPVRRDACELVRRFRRRSGQCVPEPCRVSCGEPRLPHLLEELLLSLCLGGRIVEALGHVVLHAAHDTAHGARARPVPRRVSPRRSPRRRRARSHASSASLGRITGMRSWIWRDGLVGVGGDDGERLDGSAATRSPRSHRPANAKSGRSGSVMAKGCLRPGAPFHSKNPVAGTRQRRAGHGLAERGLFRGALAARVDHLRAGTRCPSPRQARAPSEASPSRADASGDGAHHGGLLRGRDVEAAAHLLVQRHRERVGDHVAVGVEEIPRAHATHFTGVRYAGGGRMQHMKIVQWTLAVIGAIVLAVRDRRHSSRRRPSS